MAWTSIVLVSTGELATAAVQNTQVLGNITELRGGGLALASQAAGDLLRASSATQLARIAKGTGYLYCDGTNHSYAEVDPASDQFVLAGEVFG